MDYKQYYDNFIASYSQGFTTAENIGKAVVDEAQYFCDLNISYAMSEIKFNRVLSTIEQSTSEDGKMLSSSKAKTIAESRPEFEDFLLAKRKMENCDQILKALRSLQVGVLKEMNYSGQI